jgi:hypothetical protein
MHETDSDEDKAGKPAQKKAAGEDVREYGERLAGDHSLGTRVKELVGK